MCFQRIIKIHHLLYLDLKITLITHLFKTFLLNRRNLMDFNNGFRLWFLSPFEQQTIPTCDFLPFTNVEWGYVIYIRNVSQGTVMEHNHIPDVILHGEFFTNKIADFLVYYWTKYNLRLKSNKIEYNYFLGKLNILLNLGFPRPIWAGKHPSLCSECFPA